MTAEFECSPLVGVPLIACFIHTANTIPVPFTPTDTLRVALLIDTTKLISILFNKPAETDCLLISTTNSDSLSQLLGSLASCTIKLPAPVLLFVYKKPHADSPPCLSSHDFILLFEIPAIHCDETEYSLFAFARNTRCENDSCHVLRLLSSI